MRGIWSCSHGEKERRMGAHLMEGGEEMGCSFSGACVRERGGDEGGFITVVCCMRACK